MKTLQESLLDNDDVLFKNTSIERGFPKYSQLSHTQYQYMGQTKKQHYYKWTNKDLLNDICKGIKDVDGLIKSLYLIWGEDSDWMFFCFSQTNFSYAELFPAPKIIASNKQNIRKEAYELLYNIFYNNDVMKYLYKDLTKRYKDINFDEIKNEFKDTWKTIK